jgi:hypothetical protein
MRPDLAQPLREQHRRSRGARHCGAPHRPDSYILTFAGYNAGRGRVRQWVAQHGDPRDPNVDAVDWVERIPFAETRNYVQRVMENLQVYRARFGASTATIEPNLHRTATIEPRAEPALVSVPR